MIKRFVAFGHWVYPMGICWWVLLMMPPLPAQSDGFGKLIATLFVAIWTMVWYQTSTETIFTAQALTTEQFVG